VPLSAPDQQSLRLFGAAVRRERTALGMTQEGLAELTGLHLRTVQKIEAGVINVLITTVQRIQRALHCKWDRLLETE
jgi:transcriptional regulator with XRE-family HTH domain